MQRRPLHRYVVAILITCAAGAADYWMRPILGDRCPLVVFSLAVLAASWAGGLGPGLLAVFAGAMPLVYFELRPLAAHAGGQASTVAVLLLSMAAALLICVTIARFRRDSVHARGAQADAEERCAATERLYQLSSALSRAETPAEVLATCLPEIAH